MKFERARQWRIVSKSMRKQFGMEADATWYEPITSCWDPDGLMSAQSLDKDSGFNRESGTHRLLFLLLLELWMAALILLLTLQRDTWAHTHKLILNSLTSKRSFMYCTVFIHWSVAMWLQCRSETARCYCLAQGYLGTHNSGGPEHSCVLQLWDDFSDNRPSEHGSVIWSLDA